MEVGHEFSVDSELRDRMRRHVSNAGCTRGLTAGEHIQPARQDGRRAITQYELHPSFLEWSQFSVSLPTWYVVFSPHYHTVPLATPTVTSLIMLLPLGISVNDIFTVISYI